MDLDLAVEFPVAEEDILDDTDIGFSPPHSKSSENDETLDDIDTESEDDICAKSSEHFSPNFCL